MEYGTLKSEVYALNEGCAQDYYHYEVITRWWNGKDKSSVEWKHTILRTDRDGSVKRYEDFETHMRDWWDIYEQHMATQPLSGEHGFVSRNHIAEQHRWIVRHCMG